MKNNNKSIKKALKERESRYRNLVEGLNEAIYRMSLPDGKYEYFSPAVKKVFGYSAKEFLNNPLLIRKIIHPDSKNYFKEKWAELISGKVLPTYEYKIIDPKGKHRWIIQSNKGVFDSNGNIFAIEGICRDITRQKNLEETLKRSKEMYRRLFDTSPSYIVTLNKTGIITSCNKSLLKHFKNTKENIVGKHFAKLSFLSLKDIPKYLKIFASVISGKDIEPFKISWNHIDGKIYFCELFVSTIKIANKITGLQIVLNDITSRKKAKDFIKIQRDLITKLSSISNLSKALKVCTDTAIKATRMDCGGVYLVDSKTQEINLSYSKGLPDSFIKSSSKYSKDSPSAKLVMAGKPIYSQNHKLGIPLDKPIYKEMLLAIAVIPINHEGSVIACLNIASHTLSEIPVNTRNILESTANLIGGAIARLIAKEALKKSEENYRLLIVNQTDIIIKVDNKGRYLFVSPSYCKLFGKTEKEFIGKSSMPLVHKDDKESTAKAMKKINKPPYTSYVEQRAMTKYGWRYLAWTIKSIFDKNNNIIGAVASGRDITDRKKVEEDLLNSEERFKTLFEYAPDAYYINDLKGTFIDGNKAAEQLMGCKKENLTGKSFLKLKLLSPKQIIKASKLIAKNALGRPTGPDEFILNRKDGSKVTVEISTYPVKFDNKSLVLGIARDITNRKKAEEALKESEEFNKSILKNSPNPKLVYNRTFFSEEMERLQKSRDFPISIISLDVDGLKVINDYLGHSKGDKLLTILTSLVQKAIRESDIFARTGGDAFEILLPKTDYDKGREIIDRINEEIENRILHQGKVPKIN